MSDSIATPWTLAHQAPLSMGFPSQEYWNGLPFPSPGILGWHTINFCATMHQLVIIFFFFSLEENMCVIYAMMRHWIIFCFQSSYDFHRISYFIPILKISKPYILSLMFNHLYDICSKTVFMENANFMIFLIYGFSYIEFSFLCMHGQVPWTGSNF